MSLENWKRLFFETQINADNTSPARGSAWGESGGSKSISVLNRIIHTHLYLWFHGQVTSQGCITGMLKQVYIAQTDKMF